MTWTSQNHSPLNLTEYRGGHGGHLVAKNNRLVPNPRPQPPQKQSRLLGNDPRVTLSNRWTHHAGHYIIHGDNETRSRNVRQPWQPIKCPQWYINDQSNFSHVWYQPIGSSLAVRATNQKAVSMEAAQSKWFIMEDTQMGWHDLNKTFPLTGTFHHFPNFRVETIPWRDENFMANLKLYKGVSFDIKMWDVVSIEPYHRVCLPLGGVKGVPTRWLRQNSHPS